MLKGGVKVKKWDIYKIFKIIIQVMFLYVISIVGDLIAKGFKLPIPGSIIGLILLFSCLHFKIIPKTYIKDGAGLILVILPLFFIPSTVGVVQYPELLSIKGATLIVIVMISTFITMIIAGRLSQKYEITKEEVER